MTAFALFSALALGLASAAALAFSDTPAPGPGAQSQYSDPDEVLENLANGATGENGTVLSTGGQYPSGARPAQTLPASPEDAEPVNSGWPAWMIWHQR
ncbi:hypothetical protein [Dongia sp. agr-C8]